MVKPRASRAYIMPRASPLTTCWMTTSSPVMLARSWPRRHPSVPGPAHAHRPGDPCPRLLLRRHADVLDLAAPPLVDRHGPGQDVAVAVEGDGALDGGHLRGLDRVPQV